MTLPPAPLTQADIQSAAGFLLDAAASAEEKADYLAALNARGETPEEIAGFVQEFLKHAVRPPIDPSALRGPMIDVVGTGGDKLNLFNVSTTAIFILAGGGLTVVKHGNRGITSKAGGADVLEALGIRIDLPADRTAVAIHEVGLGFLFAPLYHPAFKAVVEARKILAARGQRSIFNILGPLLNPARPDYQLVGVFDEALTEPFGHILQNLGRKGSWVVHGEADRGRGMDELSTVGPNTIVQVSPTGLEKKTLFSEDFGFRPAEVNDLIGGDARHNAELVEGILRGEIQGPRRDIAVLNASAGFVITGKASDLHEGKVLAEASIDSGSAWQKLAELRVFSVE
ncbi:MAG: anthranilate phosphoribosyltransferase [Verrucomicrobiaceae bacterium]|nr:anthranilate phosphoribosyltransferase [Verrucomicrobiaceae bacterium]